MMCNCQNQKLYIDDQISTRAWLCTLEILYDEFNKNHSKLTNSLMERLNTSVEQYKAEMEKGDLYAEDYEDLVYILSLLVKLILRDGIQPSNEPEYTIKVGYRD